MPKYDHPVQRISASNSTFAGTVRITGQNVTVGTDASGVSLSVPATSSLSATGAVSISTNGSTISIGAPTQTVQTQNMVAVTLSGNTSGALALVSSGTLTLAGGNNITVSQAGNAITISGANAGGAQTAISGIVGSDATYTSGTVTFSGVGGGVTVNSNTGQRIDISVAAQSVQPETQVFIAGVSASNTLYTSGNVRISGSQAVTVRSGTGQLVIIDAPAQTTQVETQTFIAGVSASDTLYTSGNVRITGVGGGITVSSNTGQRIDLSVAAQSVQPETQTFISGISASDTLYTSGQVRITGVGGGVTVSSNTGQRVDISVAAPVAQTVQTQNLHNVTLSGNTAGVMAQISSGTLTLAGGNNITLSQNGNAVTISGGAGGVETQTAISGIANSETTYTSGSVTLSALGAITIRSTTGQHFQLSVNSQTVQTQGGFASLGVSTGGNTLGDTGVATGSRFVIVGSNGITASQGTAAGATTITLSGVTQSVQTQGGFVSMGVSTGGNTAGNTQVSTGSRFVIVASGNLTASQATAAGASTVTLSVAAQSVQVETQTFIGGLAGSNTTYTSGTVTITGVGGGVTVSSNTGQRIDISVAAPVAQTVQTQGILNVALSNVGNTSGDTGINSGTRMVLAGGNNITLSASTAANATTITISAPNLGAGAMSAGVSNLGNTAGSTGVTGTRLVLVGTNMVSLSQSTDANGGTVSINATQTVQTQGVISVGVSTGGATSGNTTVNTGSRFVLVGTNITMSQGTAAEATTVTVSAPATSSLSATGGISISTNGSTISIGYKNTINDWQNFPMGQGSLMTHISGISKTPFYFPMEMDGYLTAKSLAFKGSMVTANTLLSMSAHIGIYTFVNSTSAALLGSHSEAYVVSSATSVSLSGVRNFIMTGIGTHATLSSLSGGKYMVGMMFSAAATASMNMSLFGASTANGPLGGIYPGTNNVSAGTSQGIQALYGRGSTTVNAMPANVVASELVNQGSGASMQLHPWIYIRS